MKEACADFGMLVAYWLGELDEGPESALERHYLGCGECSARLAEVEALASGVRRAFADGRVAAVITPAIVDRLRAKGMRVREYRVPRNGSVNCTVAPEDQLVVGRMQAPLQDVSRIDAIVLYEGEFRLSDIPFEAASGEVVLAPSIVHLRRLPAHREIVRLVSVEAAGERLLGEYTFNHSAAGGGLPRSGGGLQG